MSEIIKQKFGVLMELSEFLAEHDIDAFEVKKGEFPIVVPVENKPEGMFLHPYVSLADFEVPDFVVEINRIIEWHDDYVHKGMDPYMTHTLRMARSRLSKLKKDMGSFAAALKKQFKDLEYKRRRVRDSTYSLLRKGGASTTDANAEARIKCESYDHDVTESEKNWKEAEALLDTIQNTLNCMAGEINELQKHKTNEGYAERTKVPAA